MKKLFSILIIAFICAAVSGCGPAPEESPAVSGDATAQPLVTSAVSDVGAEATTADTATISKASTQSDVNSSALSNAETTTTAKKTETATTTKKAQDTKKSETTAAATKAPATTTSASEEIPVFSGGEEEEETEEVEWEEIPNLDEWLLEMGIEDSGIANAG